MKKILTYMVWAFAAAAAVSCAKDPMKILESNGDGLTLQFSAGSMTTKAGENYENKVNKIDYFVFAYGTDGKVDSTANAVYKNTITPSDAGFSETYSDRLTTEQINTIFPVGGNTKALVFAVANYTGTYKSEKPSLNDLLEIEVRSTFADGDRWPHPLATTDETLYFVMTGSADLEMTSPSTDIELNRLASKVTVKFNFVKSVTDAHDANIIWKPQYEGPEARVYLSNAIATTTLGGPLSSRAYITDSSSSFTDGTRDIFEYSYDYLTALTGDPVYYTYPANMEAGDDNQPYLKLVLPWYAYDTRDTLSPVKQKEVYYKIALPLDALKESNRLYEYKVNVNIIGSDTEVEIGATYTIKDWFHDTALSSNLATGKYISLDIPKDEYDMYSELTQIVFISSGDVDVIVDSIYQYNYSANTVAKDQFMWNNDVVATQALRNAKGVTEDEIKGWVTNPAGTSYLQISHEMDNNMTTSTGAKNNAFDMAPYVFVVTLHLRDAGTDKTFDRTVRITQYPALYVTSRVSNGYVFINNYSNDRNGERMCYDDGNNFLGNIATAAGQMGTGTNNNPNNYMITVSTLPEGSSFVIGDPRSKTIHNLSDLGLTKYRPAESSGTENTIAPKILIASSYGAVRANSNYYFDKSAAEKRCASYQENGYPAGRWRVPTAAEIEFIMELSTREFIPSLFYLPRNDSEGYWCANGKICGDSDGNPYLNVNNNTITSVRCVYDAWYWGEEPYQAGATTWLGFRD